MLYDSGLLPCPYVAYGSLTEFYRLAATHQYVHTFFKFMIMWTFIHLNKGDLKCIPPIQCSHQACTCYFIFHCKFRVKHYQTCHDMLGKTL